MNRSPKATRRTILSAIAASTICVVTVPAGVVAPGDEAQLLRLGAEFDRLLAAWIPLEAEAERINAAIEAESLRRGWLAVDKHKRMHLVMDHLDDVQALDEASGLEAAGEAAEAVAIAIDDVVARAGTITPTTLAGLGVRAKLDRWRIRCHWCTGSVPNKDDLAEETMRGFLTLVESFAAGRAA
jgi:hypothetical protein